MSGLSNTQEAAPAGGATEATLATLLTTANFDTKVGSLTETAPTTDTASSGLNGRLQRIAQRLTSIITALGSPFQAGGSIGNTSFISTGDVAHDSADSGNPQKIGGKAIASPKGLTLVSANDRTEQYHDLDGLQMMKLNTSGGDIISERVSNTDGASTAFTNFSAVVSTKNYITGFSVFRTDAGTTPIYVDFRDGTSGSILWSVVVPPNSGANNPAYCAPALFKTSANTALAYDVSAATTTVYISVTGYQSKV